MDTVAFVFQDTYIFAESVYDNIAMHRDVSREAVEQAAKAARCHEFILSLRTVTTPGWGTAGTSCPAARPSASPSPGRF